MSKQSLLLVDGDARSLRVLEVSLRKAGFVVTPALSVQDALEKLDLHAPDLIISETTFPEGDGFELRRQVRASPEWSEIPFIFLTAEAAIENKIRGLELGVDDYLTKPIYIKEIVTRINILLQKRQREKIEERRDGRTRFAGRVQDMPVVDVIQTIEISRKSGVIQFVGERGRQAAIYFRDGRVIDAEAGALQGEDAVYRLLTWSEGEFEVMFRTVRRREVITMSSQALLMEGMRRLDEWSRLFEQLPPLTHRFEVDTVELAARLADVPDDNNRILRLFDGKRPLLEVIDACDVGDLECLQAISRLYFEELLVDLDQGKGPKRDSAKIPLVQVDAPMPMEEVSSGPLAREASTGSEDEAAFTDEALGAATGAAGASAQTAAGAATKPVAAEAGTATGTTPDQVDGDADETDFADIGPLRGGYRPSSLRLIEEAVAAAQAIEPSLFEDLSAAPAPPSADAHAGNGVPRPAPASARATGSSGVETRAVPAAQPVERSPAIEPLPKQDTASREESGLRMIGSLGRDRAEASGELAPLGDARPTRSETARELVTILPRRATREITPLPRELAESLPTPTPTSPVLASKPVAAAAVEAPASGVRPPRAASPALQGTGSGVRAPSGSFRLLRKGRSAEGASPGLVVLLIVLAAVLAGTAVFLRLRRHAGAPPRAGSAEDARSSSASPAPQGPGGTQAGPERPPEPAAGTGRPLAPSSVPAVPDRGVHGTDPGLHGTSASAPAAGSGSHGASASAPAAGAEHAADAGSASGGTDRIAEAKTLYDRAHDALEEGDFPRALELSEASLKLRKTARTYLLRAQAEQRLERIEAAIASVDAAAQIAPEYSAVWEMRGKILWAARRRDEARAAFEKFLQLEPNGAKAVAIRRMMNEPR